MKKVVYSIRKVKNFDDKLSGLGFLNDEGTLFCKCVSKNGKRYTRAFDDVEKNTNIKSFLLFSKFVITMILKKKSNHTATAGTIVSIFGAAIRGKITAKKCSTVAATKYPNIF